MSYLSLSSSKPELGGCVIALWSLSGETWEPSKHLLGALQTLKCYIFKNGASAWATVHHNTLHPSIGACSLSDCFPPKSLETA